MNEAVAFVWDYESRSGNRSVEKREQKGQIACWLEDFSH